VHGAFYVKQQFEIMPFDHEPHDDPFEPDPGRTERATEALLRDPAFWRALASLVEAWLRNALGTPVTVDTD
jgi:hypothetical protein